MYKCIHTYTCTLSTCFNFCINFLENIVKIINCHTWYHTCPYVEFPFSHCVFKHKPLPFEPVTVHILVKKSPHQLLHCGSDHKPQLLKLWFSATTFLPLYWSSGQYHWSLYTCINGSVIVLEGDSSLKYGTRNQQEIFSVLAKGYSHCIS